MNQAELVRDLQRIMGRERVLSRDTDLLAYSYDASFVAQLKPYPPDVVVRPTRTEEVRAVIDFANRHRVPVVPRGAGSNMCGSALPVRGGIVMDLSGMNRILELDLSNLQVVVEPGVVHADLKDRLAGEGFFFPPDPGSSRMCTLGGMVANNSSGMRSVKYGTTRNYVLGLEVVLPTGEVVVTGGRSSKALKSVSGYDLTQLLVGSEGTLGVITRIRLKVLPLPEARAVVMAAFDTLDKAGMAVQEVLRNRILPAAAEILDRFSIEAALRYCPGLRLPAAEAVLLLEVDGPRAAVAEEAQRVKDACEPLAFQVEWSDDLAEMERLWEARQVTGAAAARLGPELCRVNDGEDICVPVSRLPEALRRIQALAEKHGLPILTFGHIGEGNVHASVLADLLDPRETDKARAATEDIHRLALELEGSTTGEHGVGLSRAPYMELEHGPALAVMRKIKRVLDPNHILNPGKMSLDDG